MYFCLFIIQNKEKRRLLREATMKHQHMYRMAMIGKGNVHMELLIRTYP